MRRLLRDGWAWSASPGHAQSERRGRQIAAAAGSVALLGLVLLAPVPSRQRVSLAAFIVVFGVLSGLLRDQHAVAGGRFALQGVVSGGLGVGVLVVSPALWPLAVAIVLLAVVHMTALQGPGAALPLLGAAAGLMVGVAVVQGVPRDTLVFATLLGLFAGLTAVGVVTEAVADRHRLAEGLKRIDHALVTFAEAAADGARAQAVQRAVEVLLPDIAVRHVEVTFGADADAEVDAVMASAATWDSPFVRLVPWGQGLEVAVGLPMRSAGEVVGAVTLHVADAPHAEDLQLLDVLADRLTATLSAEAAFEREHAARLRLEEADLLRDQVMARVTHDLRAPLSSISGSVYTLTEHGDRLSPEMVRQLYAVLERNADRVTHWVQSLLEHAVNGHEVVLSPERIEVAELIASGVEAASQLVEGFDVRVEAADGTTVVDVTAFTRVLVNLLSNATKYAPAGSRIDVRGHRDEGLLTVVVTDRGSGVSDDDRPYLFEPFYRSQTQPAKVHGTGVGLATVRDLVSAWGGEVGHRPTRGGGATFWFTVPERISPRRGGTTVVSLDGVRRRDGASPT